MVLGIRGKLPNATNTGLRLFHCKLLILRRIDFLLQLERAEEELSPDPIVRAHLIVQTLRKLCDFKAVKYCEFLDF